MHQTDSSGLNNLLVFALPHWCYSCRLALSTFPRMNTNSSDEFFQATNHAEQTFRKMETYLQHKQLCDVLLIAGDHKIPAHRLVFRLHLNAIAIVTRPSVFFLRCLQLQSGFSWLDCECVQPSGQLNIGSAYHTNNENPWEERNFSVFYISLKEDMQNPCSLDSIKIIYSTEI